MANQQRSARLAANFSAHVLDRYRQFWSDGHMDRTEKSDFEADLVDLVTALSCVDAEDALAKGIGRARGRQLRRLGEAAIEAADRWPERVAIFADMNEPDAAA